MKMSMIKVSKPTRISVCLHSSARDNAYEAHSITHVSRVQISSLKPRQNPRVSEPKVDSNAIFNIFRLKLNGMSKR